MRKMFRPILPSPISPIRVGIVVPPFRPLNGSTRNPNMFDGTESLITPALFSRPLPTPPDWEKRETSKSAPTGSPSPGRREGVGEGTGVRDLGGGGWRIDTPVTRSLESAHLDGVQTVALGRGGSAAIFPVPPLPVDARAAGGDSRSGGVQRRAHGALRPAEAARRRRSRPGSLSPDGGGAREVS